MNKPNTYIGIVGCEDCPFAERIGRSGETIKCGGSALEAHKPQKLDRAKRRLDNCPLEGAPVQVHIQGQRLNEDQVAAIGYKDLIHNIEKSIWHDWDLGRAWRPTAKAMIGFALQLYDSRDKRMKLQDILEEVTTIYKELIVDPSHKMQKLADRLVAAGKMSDETRGNMPKVPDPERYWCYRNGVVTINPGEKVCGECGGATLNHVPLGDRCDTMLKDGDKISLCWKMVNHEGACQLFNES